MIDLHSADAPTLMDFARELLLTHRDNVGSFEDAAQAITESIFHTFRQPDGSPTFALVRVYRLTRYEELLAELRPLVDAPRERWMTLMGTYGIEPAWCDRHESQGHKALNLGVDQSPMVSAAIYQLGLDIAVDMPKAPIDLPVPEATLMTRYFHVEHAPGSPYIPAQEDFVKRYGIQSVTGVGSTFVSQSAYLLLCFARAHLSTTVAANFSQTAPFISTLLAGYDEEKIWSAA